MDSWEKLPNEACGPPFDVFVKHCKSEQPVNKAYQFGGVSNINDHNKEKEAYKWPNYGKE